MSYLRLNGCRTSLQSSMTSSFPRGLLAVNRTNQDVLQMSSKIHYERSKRPSTNEATDSQNHLRLLFVVVKYTTDCVARAPLFACCKGYCYC